MMILATSPKSRFPWIPSGIFLLLLGLLISDPHNACYIAFLFLSVYLVVFALSDYVGHTEASFDDHCLYLRSTMAGDATIRFRDIKLITFIKQPQTEEEWDRNEIPATEFTIYYLDNFGAYQMRYFTIPVRNEILWARAITLIKAQNTGVVLHNEDKPEEPSFVPSTLNQQLA
ncbi:hypothetical protein [Paraflavitalea sp. CAU 1676]|uniref:hypothetical protein n=1 Tax=Paraflavitalea sp. CAU 1676 TaxID=3032598 RepID=UPI0023DB6CF4|nr:hypothetical protein [Paraflavitalea sp. CAU 1676]MDF2192729.1 hypothetical protein [Paraflavitalea sp. CAU 1676]